MPPGYIFVAHYVDSMNLVSSVLLVYILEPLINLANTIFFSPQNFRKYMTFKKDYNELLLLLMRTLVKDALHFEEIVSGSTSRLTHVEVKVEDLKNKVSLCACFHACLSCALPLRSGF
jgi:hypothetical protein